MVSIIIPAYNQAQYLRQAITSVLTQTWRDVEIVVVDDGSTDETSSVVDEYCDDPRLRVIEQVNEGVGAARNRGIRESRGKYLCFLDADDWYHAEKVARQVAQLEAAPEVDWVYCDIIEVDAQGRPASDYSVGRMRTVLSGDIVESLLIGGYFPPHTVMVRRSALDGVGGFDRDLDGNADYDLWLRLAISGRRVEFLPERLAYYRRYDGQMSGDPVRMRETRRSALLNVARAVPDRTAAALVELQALNEELHAANQWLHGRWKPLLEGLEASHPVETTFDFIEHIRQSTLEPDSSGPPAVWDVTIAGKSDRALLLHPPATLKFDVPHAGPARLHTAVALHPDVWARSGCGPCEFEVSVDGAVGFWARIDPVSNPAHRCWHVCELAVPASATSHQVTLRTAVSGSNDYGWALWQAPRLTFPAT
jgi:glycosyltransferase involved in cell wall biosynthesis